MCVCVRVCVRAPFQGRTCSLNVEPSIVLCPPLLLRCCGAVGPSENTNKGKSGEKVLRIAVIIVVIIATAVIIAVIMVVTC